MQPFGITKEKISPRAVRDIHEAVVKIKISRPDRTAKTFHKNITPDLTIHADLNSVPLEVPNEHHTEELKPVVCSEDLRPGDPSELIQWLDTEGRIQPRKWRLGRNITAKSVQERNQGDRGDQPIDHPVPAEHYPKKIAYNSLKLSLRLYPIQKARRILHRFAVSKFIEQDYFYM
jgi:hypothetical protein